MSTWPSNRTPLTTRPSLTSRQGMMRRAVIGPPLCRNGRSSRDGSQRLGHGEAAGIEGAAGDGPRAADGLGRPQVVQVGHPARGLDLQLRPTANGLGQKVLVKAGQDRKSVV